MALHTIDPWIPEEWGGPVVQKIQQRVQQLQKLQQRVQQPGTPKAQ